MVVVSHLFSLFKEKSRGGCSSSKLQPPLVLDYLFPDSPKNGEVDIIPLISDESGIRIGTENIVTIGYGNNSVETEVIDGVVITNF